MVQKVAEIPETVLFCTKCGAENPVGKRLAEERATKEAAERRSAAENEDHRLPRFKCELDCAVCRLAPRIDTV